MFEVFGWAAIRTDTYDSDEERERHVLAELKRRAEEAHVPGRVAVRVEEGLNGGTHVLTVAGARNHRHEPALDLFRWLASAAPGSYGVLYVHDDEAADDAASNAFEVWRLARGVVEVRDDPFLSPRVPTIEDPYDPARDGAI